METFLEERLNDIDEFIQSELGFASLALGVTEPFTADEVHSLSSLLEAPGESFLSHVQGEDKSKKFNNVGITIHGSTDPEHSLRNVESDRTSPFSRATILLF